MDLSYDTVNRINDLYAKCPSVVDIKGLIQKNQTTELDYDEKIKRRNKKREKDSDYWFNNMKKVFR